MSFFFNHFSPALTEWAGNLSCKKKGDSRRILANKVDSLTSPSSVFLKLLILLDRAREIIENK